MHAPLPRKVNTKRPAPRVQAYSQAYSVSTGRPRYVSRAWSHDRRRTMSAVDGNISYNSLPAHDFPAPPRAAAFHGLAGDIVYRIEPHTEADPTAILIQTLTAYGSAIGRAPFAKVESSRHYGNLCAALVGESSKARKGTSWNHVLAILERTDEIWRKDCVASGLASGEGLIWSVRDAIEETKPVREKGK